MMFGHRDNVQNSALAFREKVAFAGMVEHVRRGKSTSIGRGLMLFLAYDFFGIVAHGKISMYDKNNSSNIIEYRTEYLLHRTTPAVGW